MREAVFTLSLVGGVTWLLLFMTLLYLNPLFAVLFVVALLGGAMLGLAGVLAIILKR